MAGPTHVCVKCVLHMLHTSSCIWHSGCSMHAAVFGAHSVHALRSAQLLRITQRPACCRPCYSTHGSQCYLVTAAVACLVSLRITDVLHRACTAWEAQAGPCTPCFTGAHKASQAVPVPVAGVPSAAVQLGGHSVWARITQQHRKDTTHVHSTAQQADKWHAWITKTDKPGETPCLQNNACHTSVPLLMSAGVCRSTRRQQDGSCSLSLALANPPQPLAHELYSALLLA
jgi:hypothetical protein